VADLGEGPGGAGPPLLWVRKEETTEGRKAGRASKTKPPPPPFSPLTQGLDPPLATSLNKRFNKQNNDCAREL